MRDDFCPPQSRGEGVRRGISPVDLPSCGPSVKRRLWPPITGRCARRAQVLPHETGGLTFGADPTTHTTSRHQAASAARSAPRPSRPIGRCAGLLAVRRLSLPPLRGADDHFQILVPAVRSTAGSPSDGRAPAPIRPDLLLTVPPRSPTPSRGGLDACKSGSPVARAPERLVRQGAARPPSSGEQIDYA